jgi:hypothetical protein
LGVLANRIVFDDNSYCVLMLKRSTAITRLVRFASEATEELARPYPGDYPVISAWTVGDLLDPTTDTLSHPLAVLLLDVPTNELPWSTWPAFFGYLNTVHRIDKGGLGYYYRPAGWPAWNAEFRRAACFWTRDGGLDEKLIEDLRARRSVHAAEPGNEEFEAQMRDELEVSRTHLDYVLGNFRERDWRNEHKGYNHYPEDHLWFAVAGYRAIENALGQTS